MSLGDSFEAKRNLMGHPEGAKVLGRKVSISFWGQGEDRLVREIYGHSAFHEAQVSLGGIAGVISLTCGLLEL